MILHDHSAKKEIYSGLDRVVLVGNPNVGKSVIFGLLTGKYVTVSNYPGTTVEISQGNILLDDMKLLVIDTPGVNNLIPMSEDEKVTRDILLAERPASVIHVGDSKNLKRTLLITIQLAEMGLPVTLALNMEDEARDRGIVIDKEKLAELLNIEVVGTIAPQRKGIRELREAMKKPAQSSLVVDYPEGIDKYLEMISDMLPDATISKRSIASMILAGDESLKDWLMMNLSDEAIAGLEDLRDECQEGFDKPLSTVINEARLGKAEAIARQVINNIEYARNRATSLIERASMHPLFGLPILAVVLYFFYKFVGEFGAGTLVDLFEGVVFEKYINPMFISVVELLVPAGLIRDMLVGEYGVITVALTYSIAIILPITATFFIAFSLLEDSGYLPRLAIMSNRIFNIIGLNGKAILPMVLGLGCGTMAVLTSRILETRKDRILTTLLLALAVPCSAQLGVILGMLGSFSLKATAIWVGSVMGVMLLVGYIAAKVVPGDKTEFFLEIPPIRRPSIANIVVKTVGRIEWYLKEAVPLFVLGTFILFLMDKLNLLVLLEKIASPVVVDFVGLPAKTTGYFILGFLRRDYGAVGLFDMAQQGELTAVQALVSLVTITLFVPCLANLFMIIKERGMKTAVYMTAFIFPFAFLIGGILNFVLVRTGISF
ncbi:MAG: ferrous iron transport protein B [Nitrospirota bacterium]|nr:MAG: ferrous iron transport protein B [Nitrospirota bacterium]